MATKTYTAALLSVPSGVTVTPTGTTGATTYGYRVSAVHNGGGETTASTSTTTATGNAALSATNFNLISWTAVPGATSYKVYGRTNGSELLLATIVPSGLTLLPTTYSDTGAATPSGALPGANTAAIASDSVGWTVKQTGRVLDNATRQGIGADTHGSLVELATGAAAVNP